MILKKTYVISVATLILFFGLFFAGATEVHAAKVYSGQEFDQATSVTDLFVTKTKENELWYEVKSQEETLLSNRQGNVDVNQNETITITASATAAGTKRSDPITDISSGKQDVTYHWFVTTNQSVSEKKYEGSWLEETSDTISVNTEEGSNNYSSLVYFCFITYKDSNQTWLCNTYKGVTVKVNASTLQKPTVTELQMDDAEYSMGDTSTDLKISVDSPDAYHAVCQWYCNSIKEIEGSTVVGDQIYITIPGPYAKDKNISSFTPNTTTIGESYYFCEVKALNADYLDENKRVESEPVYSNFVKITVNPDMSFLEGNGSETDPYVVKDKDALKKIQSYVNTLGATFQGSYFKLTTDISLSDDWQPIGCLKEGSTDVGNGSNIFPFSGIFDGGGHTISYAKGGEPLFGYLREATIKNLNVYGEEVNGCGLVKHYEKDYGADGTDQSGVPKTATFDNVTIKSGTSTKGSGFISGEVAALNTVDIINCTIENDVVIGYTKTAGKIGSFAGDFCGTITNCKSAATVYGGNYVGGLVGSKSNAMNPMTISNSSFTGKVVATGEGAGGIMGISFGGNWGGIESAPNGHAAHIVNCSVTGSVEGSDMVGGILGYESTVQPWQAKSLQNNLFTGTVKASEGKFVGGLVGYFRGMDNCNIISDNYYAEASGADRGIGGVKYLDTNCTDHESTWGENYFDSSQSVPTFVGVNDVYTHNLVADKYYRTDDPLGADADKLAKAVTADEIKDGSVTRALNNGESSLHNWKQGTETPEISDEPVAYKMEIAEDYPNEYYIGDDLDTSKLSFVVSWSDGSTKTLAGDSEGMSITGFDSSQRAFITVTAAYEGAKTDFVVKILKKESSVDPVTPQPSNGIKVTFQLLGDTAHGDVDGGTVHTRAAGNLTTWIAKKEYTVAENTTAMDVILKAFEENNLKHNANGNNQYGSYYISGVQIPGTNPAQYLSEFTNGSNSGWMYAVNGTEPEVGVNQYFLEDGDDVLMFYTDDYTKEQSAQPYNGQPYNADDVKDPATALNNALTAAKELKESDYTPESYAALTKAVEDAQKVLADKNATEDQIKSALEAIETAKAGLVKTGAAAEPIEKGDVCTVGQTVYLVSKAVTSDSEAGEVEGETIITKSKDQKSVTIPARVQLDDGNWYRVVAIGTGAFKGTKVRNVTVGKNVKKIYKKAFAKSKVKTVTIKTKKLTKASVKGSLKGSKVKTIKVKVGSKAMNKKYVKLYKKIFTKKNAGRKVKLK